MTVTDRVPTEFEIMLVEALVSSIIDEIIEEADAGVQKHGVQAELPNFNKTGHEIIDAATAIGYTEFATKDGSLSWGDILLEEVAEAFEERNSGDLHALREELIQVAAVAFRWVINLTMQGIDVVEEEVEF